MIRIMMRNMMTIMREKKGCELLGDIMQTWKKPTP